MADEYTDVADELAAVAEAWETGRDDGIYNEQEQHTVEDANDGIMVDYDSLFDDRIACVKAISSGRTSSPFNNTPDRTYVTKFRVLLDREVEDSHKITGREICSDARIPKPYAYYRNPFNTGVRIDLLALCIDINPEVESGDDDLTWIVTATFSTVMPDGGPNFLFKWMFHAEDEIGAPQNQPELERPVVTTEFETITRTEPYDLRGFPYFNAAGQPLSPPPQRKIQIRVKSITRNFMYWTDTQASLYHQALNDSPIGGWPMGFIQVLVAAEKEMYRGPMKYTRVTFKLRFAKVTDVVYGHPDYPDEIPMHWWQPNYLNAGFYQKLPPSDPEIGPPEGTRIVPCVRQGVRVSTTPALLDYNGRQITDDSEPTYIPFIEFPFVDISPIIAGVELE